MNNKPTRKPNRLKNYNYSDNGAYFITICTKDRKCTLSSVGVGVPDDPFEAPMIKLTQLGETVETVLNEMSNFYDNISIDNFVIMPNHIHLMLIISNSGSPRTTTPTTNTVSAFVSSFKRFSNKRFGNSIWQRSFYDHIIRDEADYLKITNYINSNAAKWFEDKYYTQKAHD